MNTVIHQKYWSLFHIILSLVNIGQITAARQSPPLIIKQPPGGELLFKTVQPHESEKVKAFILECEAEGEPQPTYKWVKNGKEFNWNEEGNRIIQQTGTGTLNFNNPRLEDAGQYQCSASNQWGTAMSNSVFVRNAFLNPFIDEEAKTVDVEEGKPFKLQCLPPPSGYPKPRLNWILQNQHGEFHSINSPRITVDPEGTLWFSNVTQADKISEFFYSCSAYSEFRREYKSGNHVFLTVSSRSISTPKKHAPVIQYASKLNTTALKGKTVILWCIVGGTPFPEIKWEKISSPLPDDRIEYENNGNKTLQIKDVDFTDEGSYLCNATNGVGTNVVHVINLTVITAPYFIVEPEVINVDEGERVEICCHAGGKPAPEIKWVHNGKPLEEAQVNPRRKLVGDKIIFETVTKVDTGNYGCNASNSIGYVYKDVYVSALGRPPVAYKTGNYRTAENGSGLQNQYRICHITLLLVLIFITQYT